MKSQRRFRSKFDINEEVLKHAARSRRYLADTSVKCTKDEMTTPIRPLPPWRERERRWQEITGHMCGTTCGSTAFKHPDCSLLTHQPTCTQPCKHTNSNSAGYSAGRNSPLLLSSKLLGRGAKPASGHDACFGVFRRIPYKFGFERDSNICRGEMVLSNCPRPQRQNRERSCDAATHSDVPGSG